MQKIISSNRPAKEGWLIFATLLALASGVAQLLAGGLGRITLTVIFAISLLYVLSRAIQVYLIQRRDSLERQLNIYREVLADIADRNSAEYTDKVELTYYIGSSKDDDRVVERRFTSPAGFLLYRIMEPTVNFDIGHIPRLSESPIEAWCEKPATTRIDIVELERRAGQMRVLALFRPVVNEECIWYVKYTPYGGIWDPLRKDGRDKLSWRIDFPRIKLLTVTFVTPPDMKRLVVREQDGRGTVQEESPVEQGHKLVWTDSPPQEAVTYRWNLSFQ